MQPEEKETKQDAKDTNGRKSVVKIWVIKWKCSRVHLHYSVYLFIDRMKIVHTGSVPNI